MLKILKLTAALLVMPWTVAAAPAQEAEKALQAYGNGVIELSTLDQNAPGVFLALPETFAEFDRPPGGVVIYLTPDNRIILALRRSTCAQDRFARDVICTEPFDVYLPGRIQEVGSVVYQGVLRTLYDVVIDAGTLGTGLVITDQGEYFLAVPLDNGGSSYQRVKLFVSAGK